MEDWKEYYNPMRIFFLGKLMLLFNLFVFVSNLLSAALGGSHAGVLSYLIPLILSSIYIAIMIPLIYKFGVQKSRFIIIAVMILPSMLIAALGMLMANNADKDSSMFFDVIDGIASVPLVPVAIGASVAAAIAYVLSMLLSMRIYNKKEL